MTTADLYLKVLAKDGIVVICSRNGEPIIRCVAETTLKAIKKLSAVLNALAEDRK